MPSIKQAETFARPKTPQEIVNSPSFPRRRESCLVFKNFCKNNSLHKINQDSRLRGNDGISYFSGCRWGLQRFQAYFAALNP
ncbi:hypothetical protein [Kingella sp. (in: b-proteobacteria)]|uniref:hypothetical protein n=1 Tax=Kingella sp. (in: b-proteobacteria) TaxID=2020713 RepID=UPI0026DCF996|nr:hypothetical protein [Kingella sp. (in: b-proteobacteria)]MDO4657550.1 hypothetical protein [Kingella sp. (in: b-proteobacteria)]